MEKHATSCDVSFGNLRSTEEDILQTFRKLSGMPGAFKEIQGGQAVSVKVQEVIAGQLRVLPDEASPPPLSRSNGSTFSWNFRVTLCLVSPCDFPCHLIPYLHEIVFKPNLLRWF